MNNIDKHTKTTDPLPDIQDIASHLLQPFRILYTLKQKRDKQQATIDNLNEHHSTDTTRNGLKVKHQCKLHLPPQFRERWERTLENASNNLLEVILDYQQWSLQDTNMKIQHRTQHLLNNAKDKQLAKQIITKTNELGEKYTKRTITSMIKSTKRVKRLQPNTTTTLISKHITNNQTQSSNCHSMISPIVSGHNTSTMTKPRGPPLTPPRHNATTTNHFTPPTLQRTTNNSNSHPTNTNTPFARPTIHKPSISIPHPPSRVVHLELTPDISTKAFIICLRTFVARRGTLASITSGNGSKQGVDEIFKRGEFAEKAGITWKFILEKAPWWGGYYERMVKLVKQGVRKILG